TTLDFGSITVGQNKSLTATLSASGSSVTVSSASTSNPEFSLSGVSFPLALAAGQSAPVSVTFTPQRSGTASGTISFSSNASATHRCALPSGERQRKRKIGRAHV